MAEILQKYSPGAPKGAWRARNIGPLEGAFSVRIAFSSEQRREDLVTSCCDYITNCYELKK